MNLNSQALLEDNLLWQAKSTGKKIIFYGDDTWVRLFPKHFLEYDGTTSFFVSDYTEVREAEVAIRLYLLERTRIHYNSFFCVSFQLSKAQSPFSQ